MFKFSLSSYIIFGIIGICASAPPTSNSISIINNSTLVENYAILVQDVKWFFQNLNNFVVVVDGILPNVSSITTPAKNTTSMSVSTRLHLLSGLKHLLAGIKELSITVQQSFDAAHVRKLQQLKQVESYVLQGVMLLKEWFANLRVLLSELLNLYNFYAPELVLGKCVVQYLITEYPMHAYYEYPMLLFNDVLAWATTRLSDGAAADDASLVPEKINATAVDMSKVEYEHVEQNEIPHDDKGKIMYRKSRKSSTAPLTTPIVNELAINDPVNKTKAWQKCFQMYTTETIMRQLKLYFEVP